MTGSSFPSSTATRPPSANGVGARHEEQDGMTVITPTTSVIAGKRE